jgi:hypothetical protein
LVSTASTLYRRCAVRYALFALDLSLTFLLARVA